MRALLVPAAIVALGACTASGSEDRTHGPAFDVDASSPGPADASGASDVTAPHDGAVDAGPAGDDGAIASDAAGDDASDAASDAPPACASPTEVLGADATELFLASAIGRGAFGTHAFAGSAASAPAFVAFGGAFQGLVRESSNALVAANDTGVAPLPGNPLTIDAPSLAPVGAALHGVYLGTNNRFYHATFNGTAWDGGSDPVGLPDGGAPAFGPARPSAASVGAELVIAYQGNDNHVYAQSWTGGAWQTQGTAIGADLLPSGPAVPPSLAALDAGPSDLVVVYESKADTKLYSWARDAGTKKWTGPTLVSATAFTHDAPTLAPMTGGRAIVGWRGTDGLAYTSAYDAAKVAWSVPAPLVAGSNPAVPAAPSLARGNCGDDAVAAYVSGGTPYVARYAGGAWGAPATVPGITGATFATVAAGP